MKRTLFCFLTLASLLAGTGRAKADIALDLSGVTGEFFTGTQADVEASKNALVAQGAALMALGEKPQTFKPTSINFNSTGTDNSPGAFYRAPLTGNLNNSYTLFTGQVSLTKGNLYTFSILHDDGIQLRIGGTDVITSPGPTPPRTDVGTYLATSSGPVSFNLAFGETNGPPAILIASVTATPEPATLTMAGLGLVAFGGYKLRRRKQVAG